MVDTQIPEGLRTKLVKVRRAAQITLPREMREAVHLEEGDYLEAQMTKDGILLRPVSIGRRELSAEQEDKILSVVNEERKTYAAERHS